MARAEEPESLPRATREQPRAPEALRASLSSGTGGGTDPRSAARGGSALETSSGLLPKTPASSEVWS